MKQDLTRVYSGADLSGATSGVIYLPVVRNSTLEAVSVRSDAAQSGAAVFEVRKNNVVITGLSALTITNGAKIGTVSGLNIALVDGDEITLNLLSGNVSSPITLNLATEDGQSSGGGASNNFYDPDKPSASPSAIDDDFTGTALNGAWSQFGAADMTLAVADDLLQISQDSQTSYKLSGVYKAIPSGSFSIVAKVLPNSAPSSGGSFIEAGFALLEDGADAGKKLATLGFLMNDTTYKFGQVERWASRTVFAATDNGGANIEQRDFRHWRYLRLDYDGASYKLYSSRNGFEWGEAITFALSAFTPLHVGFFLYNYASGATRTFYVDWIRKYAACPKYLGGGR